MDGDGMTHLLQTQVCRQLEVIPEGSTQAEAALSEPFAAHFTLQFVKELS